MGVSGMGSSNILSSETFVFFLDLGGMIFLAMYELYTADCNSIDINQK
jgi:hypothetical protein